MNAIAGDLRDVKVLVRADADISAAAHSRFRSAGDMQVRSLVRNQIVGVEEARSDS